jgi:hypothetical protein
MEFKISPFSRLTRSAGLVCALIVACLSGCASGPPPEAFRMSATALEDRQMQSRRFDTLDETGILASSVGVLQDLGYALDISNADLGVLTASKELDATNAGQVAAMILLAALGGGATPIDDDQKVRVCIVVNESLEDKGSSVVRITLNRFIWNTQGQITKAETLKDPELYQAFFAKLSKATFLEAHQI